MSMNINLEELNNLDMSDMGSWPVAAKAMVVAILVLMIGVLTFFLLVDDQIKQLEICYIRRSPYISWCIRDRIVPSYAKAHWFRTEKTSLYSYECNIG